MLAFYFYSLMSTRGLHSASEIAFLGHFELFPTSDINYTASILQLFAEFVPEANFISQTTYPPPYQHIDTYSSFIYTNKSSSLMQMVTAKKDAW